MAEVDPTSTEGLRNLYGEHVANVYQRIQDLRAHDEHYGLGRTIDGEYGCHAAVPEAPGMYYDLHRKSLIRGAADLLLKESDAIACGQSGNTDKELVRAYIDFKSEIMPTSSVHPSRPVGRFNYYGLLEQNCLAVGRHLPLLLVYRGDRTPPNLAVMLSEPRFMVRRQLKLTDVSGITLKCNVDLGSVSEGQEIIGEHVIRESVLATSMVGSSEINQCIRSYSDKPDEYRYRFLRNLLGTLSRFGPIIQQDELDPMLGLGPIDPSLIMT